MAYTKQTWADGSAGGTPLSASRLNFLENGVGAVHSKVDSEIAPVLTAVQEDVIDVQTAQATPVTIERMTPGSVLVIDYFKTVYGAASAWPAARPTARIDLDVVWRGPTDPGSIMLAGDIFDLAEAA